MILTANNYYSQEANMEYISVSQYKNFEGSMGKSACEAEALAKLRGEWEEDKTTALLVGQYVDTYFEGTLESFKKENPTIFTKNGTLKADYRQAEMIIRRIERDKLFMQFMSGQKQIIMTGELFGAKWKIKMDSYIPDTCITDLKIMESLKKHYFIRDFGYMDFTQYWGYDYQGAIYQEIVYQNTGKRLPFYIAAASKEKEPDIEVIQIDDQHLKEKLYDIEKNIPNILALKRGEIQPLRCECCNYCKHTKVLTRPIHFSELLGVI